MENADKAPCMLEDHFCILEGHMPKTTGLLIFVALLVSCENNSTFRASSKRQSAEIPVIVDPKTENQLPRIADAKDCTEIKFVNIVMVLDNSRSQMLTDPNKVRALAAAELVSKLETKLTEQASAKLPMPEFSFASVSFATSARMAKNGWVALKSKDELNTIIEDIDASTVSPLSDMAGCQDQAAWDCSTHYSPALEAANQLLQSKAQNFSDDTGELQSNFVIFLTDGEPKDKAIERQTALDELITANDAAVIAVAAGTGVEDEGIEQVQALALPLSNLKKPKHVGQFIRAAESADLTRAFDEIFKRVSTCS
jgi:hypothetical protein